MEIQNQIMLDAINLADKCVKSGKCSLMLCQDGWHGGVMGIIAGRLKINIICRHNRNMY